MSDVHGLDLSSIGVLLAINGGLKPVCIVLASVLADQLCMRRMRLRIVHVRKLITVISFVPQGIFLLALAANVLNTPQVILPCLLLVAPLNIACNGGGYAVNHLDIAPQLASLVLAFYNTGGQVAGWMIPWLIGEMTPYPNGESRAQMEASGSGEAEPSAEWVATLSAEWRITFLLGGCCNLIGAAFYVAFASDRVQPWARLARQGASESELMVY